MKHRLDAFSIFEHLAASISKGLHGMRTRTARRTLTSGKHSLKMDFFERGGGAGMVFKYRFLNAHRTFEGSSAALASAVTLPGAQEPSGTLRRKGTPDEALGQCLFQKELGSLWDGGDG